jgi:adenylate kinase family enzyme
LLVGNSTAGKTSIITEFKKRNPNWQENGIDKTLFSYTSYLIHAYFPLQYQKLTETLIPSENQMAILLAIFKRVHQFREGITEQQKKLSIQAAGSLRKEMNFIVEKIYSCLFEDVMQNSLEGIHTIFDSVGRVEDLFRYFALKNFHGRIRLLFVYCPLEVLSNRIIERTRKAIKDKNEVETRVGTAYLFQYAKLCKPQQNPDEHVIENLTRSSAENVFNLHFNIMIDDLKDKEPANPILQNAYEERKNGLEKFLVELGFISSDIQNVVLTPRYGGYDDHINTSKVLPNESALLLTLP